MARKANQKLKLLYIMRLLYEKTDEEHGLEVKDIIAELEAYNISAERKSIYEDLEALQTYGIDINRYKKNRSVYYYIGAREFEVPELKLLVEAVQSSKFITEKKSRELIQKLEQFASQYEAKKLERQVYVKGRIKTMNESIYYNVDKLHQAIGTDAKIKFQYFQWNINKEMELRHNGQYYIVSPWGMLWDNENYYLIGYDENRNILKHFRVDKMMKISLLKEKRSGKELFDKLNLPEYAKKHFGMFDGEEQTVKLLCENECAGIIIDRFGKDVTIRKADETHFYAIVDVVVSGQFLGWIIGLGEGIQIVSPSGVCEQMLNISEQLRKQYQ